MYLLRIRPYLKTGRNFLFSVFELLTAYNTSDRASAGVDDVGE